VAFFCAQEGFVGSRLRRIAVPACVLTLAACLQAQTQGKEAPKPAKPAPKATSKETRTPNPLVSEFRSFSANVSGGIADDHDRKIYRSGNLMRLDFEGEYRITDLDTLTMWGVAGDRCTMFGRPDAGTFPFSAYHDFKVERSQSPEEETVDGHLCKIENVTLTPTDGRLFVVKMKLSEAKDLDGFPIRIDVDAGRFGKFTSTYTNVSRKEPDPKLFQHPAKCTPGLQQGQEGTVKIVPPAPKKDSQPPQKPPQP
jgi:hypothetical protein